MSSRQYVKRIWRVPKDRGALECFAVLVVKALRKHGWPAEATLDPVTEGFLLHHVEEGFDVPLAPDFQAAAELAVRIVARTYRVDVTQHSGWVGLNRRYSVNESGHFREEKNDPARQG